MGWALLDIWNQNLEIGRSVEIHPEGYLEQAPGREEEDVNLWNFPRKEKN